MVQINGSYDPKFQAVADVLGEQVEKFGGGAAICVYQDGQPVIDIWAGSKDHNGAPWEQDTIAMSFSTTKGVLMTALHVCASRGLIDYDQPVAKYWPEFAANGKENITVRQLASHQAGLYRFPRDVHFSAALGWRPMAEALAKQRPAHKPGRYAGYHAMTIAWLIGELVNRVSGKPIDRFIADEIAKPLDIDGLFVGVPASALPRIAPLNMPLRPRRDETSRPKLNLRGRARRAARKQILKLMNEQWRAFYAPGIGGMMHKDEYHQVPIPSANGHFTARALAKMYAMLANDGELDGVRLIERDIVEKATAVQVRGPDRIIGFPMQWSLGYHRFGRNGAFGHFGMGGSGAWAYRPKRVAAALVHNGNPLGIADQFRMVGVTRAVVKSL